MASITTRTTKGSALTWAEADANLNNLNTAKLENVVEDTTPQLGGDLDVNGRSIVSASNGNINITPNGSGNIALTPATGKIILGALDFPTGTGSNGQVLTTNGSSALSFTTISAGATTLDGLSDVVITAAATNDVLVYNGTNWVDTAANTLTVSAASTATTATTATNVTVTQTSTSATYYPLMSTTSGTGDKAPVLGTNFTMNPSTGALTAVSLTTSGSITPNSTGGPNINFGTSTLTASAWTTLGISLRQQARNYTDSSSSGTVAVSAINGFGISTLNSTNAITVTEASTFYIQPPAATGNTTITTAYGLISTGRIKASDFVGTIGATTASTGAFTTLSATGAVTFTPTASINISPTGITNTVTIAPATTGGSINNMSIGGTTAAAGTFTALTSTGLTTLKTYKETISTGGSQASAYTPDYSLGTVHTVTLTGNVTFAAPTNMVAGNSLTLILTQDATGGRTATWNASYKWLGGTPTLSTTGASIDVVNIFYDGTNYITGISKQDTSSSVSGLTITAAGELRLADTDSSNYVGFKSPATVTTNNVWTLPATDGTNGQVLSTNGSDVLSWITPGGGGASVAIVYVSNQKGTLITGAEYRAAINEKFDPSGIISIASNEITCAAAGTYMIEMGGNEFSTGGLWQHKIINTGTSGDWVDENSTTTNGDNFASKSMTVGGGTTQQLSFPWVWSWRSTVANAKFNLRYLLNTAGDTISSTSNVYFKITKIG